MQILLPASPPKEVNVLFDSCLWLREAPVCGYTVPGASELP